MTDTLALRIANQYVPPTEAEITRLHGATRQLRKHLSWIRELQQDCQMDDPNDDTYAADIDAMEVILYELVGPVFCV